MALVNNLKKKQETAAASKAPETVEEPKSVNTVTEVPTAESCAPEASETEGDHTNAAQIYKMAKALVSDLKFMRKKAAKGDLAADWNGMIKATTEEYIKVVRKYAGLDK